PRGFLDLGAGILRHMNGTSYHHGGASERQVDDAAVPIVELNAVLCRQSSGINRPPRMLRQLHDAHARDARHLWHVGRERDIVAALERFQHFGESGNAALAVEFAVVGAGTANGTYTKLVGNARVDLAVAVARDQRLGWKIIALAIDERCHEMLAVPKPHDYRLLGRLIDCRRFDRGSRTVPDQAQIPCARRGDGFLESRRCDDTLE